MESQAQSKSKKYTGFESYVLTGEFTPEFIKDFEYWSRKIFRRWTLFTEFDNFYGICWESLLSKIKEFDPKIASIQTFCIFRIINAEAWRLYMNNKSVRPEVDSDDPVIQGGLIAKTDIETYDMFNDFIKYANSFGIKVNLEKLYEDYTECKETPGTLAFISWRSKYGKMVGVYK